MDDEYEPMDVDLSCNSIHAMDISYNDSDATATTPKVKIKEEPHDSYFVENGDNTIDNENITVGKGPTVIKRFSLNIPPHKETMNRLSNTTLYLIIIFALISIITYQIVNFECSKELDLNVLKLLLSKNVVGQPEAIKTIISSLEEKSHSKILFIYGGTGVGKTFTMSLMLGNLYHFANIYHYTMPSFVDRFSTDFLFGLTLCPTSLIVVDDLNRTDMHIRRHVEELIKKSENLNRNITIILIFNCDTINDHYVKKCDYTFYADLKRNFSEINASKWFIKYNSLTEEHLRRCIENELNGKSLTEGEFKNFVKNFNVTTDGCKGVYTKIKLLNIL